MFYFIMQTLNKNLMKNKQSFKDKLTVDIIHVVIYKIIFIMRKNNFIKFYY